MNNYKNFILNSKKNELIEALLTEGLIEYSDDFKKRIMALSNKSEIARKLMHLYHSKFNDDDIKQNYINITDKDDEVSFLSQKKFNDIAETGEVFDPYQVRQRSQARIGRLAKSILSLGMLNSTDKEIEEFVDLFKSTKIVKGEQFKIVKGDDIKYWYHRDNYLSTNGTLGRSCMCEANSDYFDIYSYSQNCNMLILTDYDEDEGREKLIGRALIWNISDDSINSHTFMDRVYTARSSDVNKFKEYANNNNWFYKKFNNHDKYTNMYFILKDSKFKKKLEVEVDGNCDYYPYLDTLKFLNREKTKLSNIGYPNGHILEDTEGGTFTCETCDGTGHHCDVCNGRLTLRCNTCRGSGEINCGECKGVGYLTSNRAEFEGDPETVDICTKCHSGKLDCINCNGKGNIECSCVATPKLCQDCTGLMQR